MEARNAVEFADRIARRRVIGTTAATVAFLAVQLVARPVFRSDGYAATGPRSYMWALNAGVLLLLLLPIGGYVWGRRVRELVNDEVSRRNSRTATAGAFWLAMITALAVYVSRRFATSPRGRPPTSSSPRRRPSRCSPSPGWNRARSAMDDRLENRLREERARRGYTQAQLAELVNVSRKTINTVENGIFIPSTVLALPLGEGTRHHGRGALPAAVSARHRPCWDPNDPGSRLSPRPRFPHPLRARPIGRSTWSELAEWRPWSR
jgi:putative transcriptional regulator